MKAKIAIIGKGNVGSALQAGLQRAGYEVKAVGEDTSLVRELSAWGDVIILAVPYLALDDAIRTIGDAVRGKTLVDATNALTEDYQLAIGFTTSGAEELQNTVTSAKVVKAFNTVFAEHMSAGKKNGTPLTLLVAGDDKTAKQLGTHHGQRYRIRCSGCGSAPKRSLA